MIDGLDIRLGRGCGEEKAMFGASRYGAKGFRHQDEGVAGPPGILDFPGSPRDGREDATPAGEGPVGSGADDGMSFLIGGDDFPGAAGDPGSGGGELDLPSLDDWDDLLGDSGSE